MTGDLTIKEGVCIIIYSLDMQTFLRDRKLLGDLSVT